MAKEDQKEISRVLDDWRRAWRTIDIELMLSVFDVNDPGFVYQSEEAPDALRNGEELRLFWENARVLMPEPPTWVDLGAKVDLYGPLAVVFTQVDATIIVKGVQNPIAGPIRVTLILRRGEEGWKVVHYHESRQANLEEFGLEDVQLYHTLEGLKA